MSRFLSAVKDPLPSLAKKKRSLSIFGGLNLLSFKNEGSTVRPPLGKRLNRGQNVWRWKVPLIHANP